MRTIRFAQNAEFELGYDDDLGVITLSADAEKQIVNDSADAPLYFPISERKFERIRARFIPYYAFANRGECEMLVFTSVI